jgi:site-specific DNA-methyltransferase (adenine-specific)
MVAGLSKLAGIDSTIPIEEDEAPNPNDELAAKWGTASGQLWKVHSSDGTRQHRVYCGDSSARETFAVLCGEERADLLLTDPPYGVAIGAKNRMLNSFQPSGRNLTPIENDAMSAEGLGKFLEGVFALCKTYLQDCASVYMTAPQDGDLGEMMMMMRRAGLPIRHVLIWVKNSPTFSMGRLDYDYQHEPILYTWNKSHKFYGRGDQKTSVWEYDKPRASAEHPTMKPVALFANAILNSTLPGMIVLDPFLGSGTTLIAAEQSGARCFGVEIDPRYVAVILERAQAAGMTCESETME